MHSRMIKKKIFYEIYALQARSFMKKNAPHVKLIKQNASQADFLDLVLMGILSY